MQVARSPKVFDAVVVGSGAGGGTAVQRLTGAGLDVALLEGGPSLNPSTDYRSHNWPYEFDDRGRSMNALLGGNQLPGEPYSVAAGQEFQWWRARVLGGRTNNWGRHSYRMAEWDFRCRDRYDYGDNWPIAYSDLAPYYSEAERLMGVCGTKEGIPSLPDGDFLPPMKPKCHEVLLGKGARKIGMPMIPIRRAVLTRNALGRPACHWCGACNRGCMTGSKYCSIQYQIDPALAGGNLTLLTDSMAREVLTDSSGEAIGISYIDTRTGEEKQIRGKRIVLAASSIETARLLLNSHSPHHPQGLGNSSGHLGKHLTDTIAVEGTFGLLPQLLDRPRVNEDGVHSGHVMIPWWKYDRKNEFAGGYHIEVFGGYAMPLLGTAADFANTLPGHGKAFKRSAREHFGAYVRLGTAGESFANEKSFVEIDPNGKDRWGIPTVKIHFEWTENDYLMAEDIQTEFRNLIEAAGGKVYEPPPSAKRRRGGIQPGGAHIHELGTARMGTHREDSVTNPFGQLWDSPNVSVVDGSTFVTNPDKNPTLTIAALCLRACDRILEEGA
ncbi:MAG: GMC family oxidoreductase [Acidobacteria bacterium]|nr:GMC family oxidoreductase [Acidobacteriota bacterium]